MGHHHHHHMTACTTGPQTISFPAGLIVSLNASVKSSRNESVEVKDSNGNTVSRGSGSSSSGGTFTVINMEPPTFISDGNDYTVELSPQATPGILQTESSRVDNGRLIWQNYAFGANDGGCIVGDRDFNDVFVLITGLVRG
uniref:Thrombocorticin n=1 Tax=Corticium sp. (in: basidiomycete fungi) TaxID=1935377 RepID=UPI00209BBADE|nr:Chain A, Thrombocorticin Q25K mutant [Corticium sp. (in: basidiomycete fungi)]7F9J_B Chain B, Thrombocorticin Q25K mutant [Corticium sp. (in: basidiomycete fungi)]